MGSPKNVATPFPRLNVPNPLLRLSTLRISHKISVGNAKPEMKTPKLINIRNIEIGVLQKGTNNIQIPERNITTLKRAIMLIDLMFAINPKTILPTVLENP